MLKLQEIDKNNISHLEQVLLILNESYAKVSYPPTLNSIQKSTINYFFLTNDNDEVVGTTGYKQVTPTLYETVKTVIAQKFQGMGFGKLASQKIEDHVIALGAKKVMTTIYKWNTKMIQIKLDQGYVIEGFHPDHEAPGFDEYSLGKVVR
jgi:RimJ/RimL family protein N-acetyltransferase